MGGVGPISFLAIDRAADRFGFDTAEDFEEFFDRIKILDGVWLSQFSPAAKHEAAKRKEEERRQRELEGE